MNTTRIPVAALIAGALLLGSMQGRAQDKAKADNPQASPDEQEMMKKWEQVSTPGEAQKKLGDLEGTWDVEMSIWMGGPEHNPTVTHGAAVNSWVLGGRYLRQEYKGEMMGMPFEGIGYTGYDNYNKKYVGFWIDNSTTQMATMSGLTDRSGRVFTFYGTMDEWMTGENGKAVKYVTRIVNKDKHIFEVYDLGIDGPNQRVMEAVYTRKK